MEKQGMVSCSLAVFSREVANTQVIVVGGGEFHNVIEGMLQNKTCAFPVDPYRLLLTHLFMTFGIN